MWKLAQRDCTRCVSLPSPLDRLYYPRTSQPAGRLEWEEEEDGSYGHADNNKNDKYDGHNNTNKIEEGGRRRGLDDNGESNNDEDHGIIMLIIMEKEVKMAKITTMSMLLTMKAKMMKMMSMIAVTDIQL